MFCQAIAADDGHTIDTILCVGSGIVPEVVAGGPVNELRYGDSGFVDVNQGVRDDVELPRLHRC